MPYDAGYSDADEPAQPGAEPASGPEPTPAHRVYESSHGEAYRPGYLVRVRVRNDPHGGETGRVQSNYNDGGDMIHVLLFEDGTTAEYHYDDLTRP